MPHRSAQTFSIVARDTATRALGAAIYSRRFDAGQDLWLRAGVGAVVSQSFVDPLWGPDALGSLASGTSPKELVAALIAGDKHQALRQVGIVTAGGEGLAHTGERCVAQASHHHGQNFSVQASMMMKSTVVPAMVAMWEGSTGRPLADRLIEVLRAGHVASEETHGTHSAAVLVTPSKDALTPGKALDIALRVSDHTAPIDEIARLHALHQGWEHLSDAEAALTRDDREAALGHYETAAELLPEDNSVLFWRGLLLIQSEDTLAGTVMLRRVFTREKNWIEFARRLGDSEIIDQETVAKIMRAVPT